MPGFTNEYLAQLRPFAYHTTSLKNLKRIEDLGRLESVRSILKQSAHHSHLLLGRRIASTTIMIGQHLVDVQDQLPLRPGSIKFQDGWELQDLLDELNSRVFFWPGDEERARGRSESHYEKYAALGEVAVLRMPLESLLASNPTRRLYVSRCNSGSARSQQGKPVARGPQTFTFPETADFTRGKVIELSLRGEVTLPAITEWSSGLQGPWRRLLRNA